MLALLPTDGQRLSTQALVERVYPNASDRPFNARVIVSGLMRGIMRKTDAMGGPFRICASPRRGPHAIEYWVE